MTDPFDGENAPLRHGYYMDVFGKRVWLSDTIIDGQYDTDSERFVITVKQNMVITDRNSPMPELYP